MCLWGLAYFLMTDQHSNIKGLDWQPDALTHKTRALVTECAAARSNHLSVYSGMLHNFHQLLTTYIFPHVAVYVRMGITGHCLSYSEMNRIIQLILWYKTQ